MSGNQSLTTLDPSAFDIIEAAVAETARGRWFLAEYARRNRNADTEMLLGAIGKLESAVASGPSQPGVGRLRGDLMEMADAIARTRAEISAISAPDQDRSRLGGASEALDAIVRETERATSDILSAAEEVQEAAWTLRENGADGAVCDELDRRATQIYTACSFQDLTAQRTGRIVHTLRYLEERLIAMIAIWGKEEGVPPAPGPSGAAADPILNDLCQSDVDRFIDMDAPVEAPAASRRPPVAAHDDLIFLSTEIEAGDLVFAGAAVPLAVEAGGSAPEEESWPRDSEDAPKPASATLAGPETATTDEDLTFDEPAARQESRDGPEAAEPPRKSAAAPMDEFADIDELTIEEKLALFT